MSWKRVTKHGRYPHATSDPGLLEVDCESPDRWRDQRTIKHAAPLVVIRRNALFLALIIVVVITVVFMIHHKPSQTTLPEAASSSRSAIKMMQASTFKVKHSLAWRVIENIYNPRDQLSETEASPGQLSQASELKDSHRTREEHSLAASKAFLELFLTQIFSPSQSDGVSNTWTPGSPYLLPHELQKAEAKNMMGLLHQLWVVHTQKSSPSRIKDSGTVKCLESSLLNQFAHAAKKLTAASCGQSGWIWSLEGDGLTYVLLRRLSVAMLHLLHGEMSGRRSEGSHDPCNHVLDEVRLII